MRDDNIMNNLPHLVLNQNAQLIRAHGLFDSDVRERFFSGLQRGDRYDVHAFCTHDFAPEQADFRMYQLIGFYDYEYAFLEKDKICENTVNIVYFASAVSDFYPMMSLYSQYYRDITGKCMYEILYLSHKKSASASYLTPAALLVLDQIPHLRDELLDDSFGSEYCDLHFLTKSLLKQFGSISAFRKTKFSLCTSFGDSEESNSTDNSMPENYLCVIEFSVPAYVYLFTSLIHIFHALSEDHNLPINLSFSQKRGQISFSVKISHSREIVGKAPIESSNLTELSRFVPSMENIAKVASIVAYNAKISTSLLYDNESHTLKTTLGIGYDVQSQPKFHFRDPYSDVPVMTEEFCKFIQMLLGDVA